MRRSFVLGVLLAVAGCRTDEVVGYDVLGPPCDCNSLFPMCVGTSWTYSITDARTGAVTLKTLSITDWRDPDRPEYGLSGFKAFRQRRVTPIDSKDSWLARSDDGLRTNWLFDEWFDIDGRTTRVMVYSPSKLRLDERPEYVNAGAMWHESYQERRIQMMGETILDHEVDWTTPAPQDHDGFAASICEHKLDVTTPDDGPVDATYCFVRGVGKVWELTLLAGEENLSDWTVPGCSP